MSFSDYLHLTRTLQNHADSRKAEVLAKFFKTGLGEYGQGDIFLGISVPVQRKIARQFRDLVFANLKKFLKSPIHEHRFVALEILVMQYENGHDAVKKRVADFYLEHTRYINNWDLVDTSAPYILGDFFLSREKDPLYLLAKSENLWERRISIISTHTFIKHFEYRDALRIARILLHDAHDLIHKAVGWMLREIGNHSLETELKFLDRYFRIMPRTMLRYAIEKFSRKLRNHYLKK